MKQFDESLDESAYRAEVRAFLGCHAPLKQRLHGRVAEDVDLARARDWQRIKADAGFAGICIDRQYGGRGGTVAQQLIYDQEEARYAVPAQGMVFVIGLGMCIGTLLAFASEQCLQRHVAPAIRGDELWCQLFSEPSGGSDLAALRTRAEKSGNKWVINGQKVWTSNAHVADYGLLLARTDPSVAKHAGLTAFYVDMKSPGVEVRPIRQMNGVADFNEVFLTNVSVPDDHRLGAPGDGWKVALHTLMNERLAVGSATPGPKLDDVIDLARGDASSSLKIRFAHQIAQLYVREQGVRHAILKTTASLINGQRPGPEASVIKFVNASLHSEVTSLLLEMQGAAGVVSDPEFAYLDGWLQSEWLRSPGEHLGGGTDEILLNVIAERVLGLPPDHRPDRTTPFNQLAA